MQKIILFLALAALLVACAPDAATLPAGSLPTEGLAPTRLPVDSTPLIPAVVDTPLPGEPAAEATSRGDALIASDPLAVTLGTGKPTLVEFFRFT